MNYHIVEARHLRAHTLWLMFRDGTAGEIDLAPELHGPVMGADFAPEFLHDNIHVTA